MTSVATEDKIAAIRRLQKNPALHIREAQGVETLTAYQEEACQAIADHQYVCISACHDVGKTFLMARAVLWFGSVFPRCKIITTAPTWSQVELLLWSEIRAGWAKSKTALGGRMLTTEWKIDDDWFAVGLSPKDDADTSGGGQGKTSGFQGFHAPYVFIIFDEATGISLKRWIQAQGMLTSANVKFVVIGNPTTKNSEFARCFKNRLWKKIYITCFDSPNLIANGVTSLPLLIEEINRVKAMSDDEAQARLKSYKVVNGSLLTLQWVVERGIVWGVEHPLFQSKVLGQFPDEDDSTLISLGTVEAAQIRQPSEDLGQSVGLGVDVARYGDDSSVLTTVRGKTVRKPKTLMKKDVTVVAGATIREIQGLLDEGIRPELIHVGIDCTGIGAGVYDLVVEAQKNNSIPNAVSIHEVHFGHRFDYLGDSPSSVREREDLEKMYMNRKAKIFVELAQDLKNEMSLPPEMGVYLEELPTLMIEFNSKGLYQMESKEDYRDRTGRSSPDHADSLAIANEMRKMKSNSVGVIRVV